MGGTGDSPVLVGDPPTGMEEHIDTELASGWVKDAAPKFHSHFVMCFGDTRITEMTCLPQSPPIMVKPKINRGFEVE